MLSSHWDFLVKYRINRNTTSRSLFSLVSRHTLIQFLLLPQWSGQASLPHLKLKDLQMSDSRELSTITTSSMYLLLHHFLFLSFFFLWRISKIPKTATVTSPICQALRSARSLGHFSCFFLYLLLFYLSVNFQFFARAVSFKLMPTYWKWRPKKSLLILFWIFERCSLSSSLHYSVFAMDCPQWGDEML